MSDLDEILDIKTEELKEKAFNEFLSFKDNVDGFTVNHKGKSYVFEVHAYKSNNGIKIMVECARNMFFLSMFGKAKYFYVHQDGRVKNITGIEFETLPP